VGQVAAVGQVKGRVLGQVRGKVLVRVLGQVKGRALGQVRVLGRGSGQVRVQGKVLGRVLAMGMCHCHWVMVRVTAQARGLERVRVMCHSRQGKGLERGLVKGMAKGMCRCLVLAWVLGWGMAEVLARARCHCWGPNPLGPELLGVAACVHGQIAGVEGGGAALGKLKEKDWRGSRVWVRGPGRTGVLAKAC
jgi:hypothetical protein